MEGLQFQVQVHGGSHSPLGETSDINIHECTVTHS